MDFNMGNLVILLDGNAIKSGIKFLRTVIFGKLILVSLNLLLTGWTGGTSGPIRLMMRRFGFGSC